MEVTLCGFQKWRWDAEAGMKAKRLDVVPAGPIARHISSSSITYSSLLLPNSISGSNLHKPISFSHF